MVSAKVSLFMLHDESMMERANNNMEKGKFYSHMFRPLWVVHS
jgi:hypothetical protein